MPRPLSPARVLATRLTRLQQPKELFTLSSSALLSDRDSCGPTTAVRNLGELQALAFVFEYNEPYQRDDFPPRPRRLRLPAGGPQSIECFGEGWGPSFREHGRAFQITVAVGRAARGGPTERRLLRARDTVTVASPRGS